MTNAECLIEIQNHIHLIGENINADLEIVEIQDEGIYNVEEVVIAPLQNQTAFVRYRTLYNETRDFEMALMPFINQNDLCVALFVRVIDSGTFIFIPVAQ
jgi:hypothetical protein